MFRKILIANRGEIALRVISACKELGVRTVAVYSEADRYALHVRFADEAICIGPSRSADSYLKVASIISAAEITDSEAIHPGYGFLSENAHFAEVCETSKITFIGPKPATIRLMGDKDSARKTMASMGLPVLPGTGVLNSIDEAMGEAARIGFPVMIKAAAGGGGRGMRPVRDSASFAAAFETAQAEAQAAFGSPALYLEKLIAAPRHIEFQVMGDSHHKVVHLGERECTIQRRHQKLVEESPSPAIDPGVRERLGKQIVKALTEMEYLGAGTVEFLMDEKGSLYFLEMNTRIQVEHAVTEMVTGLDLVKQQILIAAGECLGPEWDRVTLNGHAIECRICAEDPRSFTPSAGKITGLHLAGGPGVRTDHAIYTEAVIPPYYDSLAVKMVCHGRDRKEAIQRMKRALEMSVISGISTLIPLHQKIMADPDFCSGRFDTRFIERYTTADKASKKTADAATAK